MPPARAEKLTFRPKKKKSPTCCKFENLKFSKKLMNFKTPLYTRQKKTTFGTKYLKTHVHRVISKIVFPTPQLDIKFLNP